MGCGAGATNGTGAGGAGSAEALGGGISAAVVVVDAAGVVLLGTARVVLANTVVTGPVVVPPGDDAGPQPDITTAPMVAAAKTETLRHSNRRTWPFMPTDPALIPCACTPFSNALAQSVPTTLAYLANRAAFA
ncbi:hypothetical protein ACWELJ_01015 [Nocardia sp. NPDC004582]